jgi:hypothetical protein
MKQLRISITFVAIACIAAWGYLRRPYSPTEDLPTVAYSCFQISDPAEGTKLAEEARRWPDLTAVSFNENSGLLVVSRLETTPEPDIQKRLQAQSKALIVPKFFPEPEGPKCPVPFKTLAELPGYLLKTGLATAFMLFISFLMPLFQTLNKHHYRFLNQTN